MTLTPELKSTEFRNCIIDFKTTNKNIIIEPTHKRFPSQFIIEVNSTKAKYAQIETWLELKNYTILVYRSNNWINIKDIYPSDGNKVRIDIIKLKKKVMLITQPQSAAPRLGTFPPKY